MIAFYALLTNYHFKHQKQVGKMTLGGLLALGYNVVVSYKRASTSVNNGNVSMSLETIDTLKTTIDIDFYLLKKTKGRD